MKKPIDFLDENDVLNLLEAFKRLVSGVKEQAIKDLFSLGCYLHSQSDQTARLAGWKASLAALDALELGQSGLLRKIMDTLDGNELALSRLFAPHNEITKLFDRDDG